nr:hypothetical protein [Kitasatospora aureofaciens]
MLLRWFTDLASRALFPPEDHEVLARAHVASLRAAHAARPGGRRAAELLAELRVTEEEFAACWQRHEVAVRAAAASGCCDRWWGSCSWSARCWPRARRAHPAGPRGCPL